MNKDSVDCVVIGAGVVGLAVARALALAGRAVFVLEAADRIGSGISSRNSEVIHAGIYYPAGSLKARLCVLGRDALYAYAAERGIAHSACGKIIVATDAEQVTILRGIQDQALVNGVSDLVMLSSADVAGLEPELQCVSALLSPSTGIVDAHDFMVCLHGDITHAGGEVVLSSPVSSMCVTGDGIAVYVGDEADQVCLSAKTVINAAGLAAVPLAHRIEGFPREMVPTLRYAKGHYFSLAAANPFSHLIYPVPEDGGLGVHLTMDLAGKARFGPDVEWVERIDYSVPQARAAGFYPAIRRYWPSLPDGSLVPDYAGIRPKVSFGAADGAVMDFVIQGADAHGVAGLVNLFGIESPGLTASLAIGDYVRDLVG